MRKSIYMPARTTGIRKTDSFRYRTFVQKVIIVVIFLVGPTASGKSEMALKIALETDGEIVSADSMQVYRGLDIGTSKLSVDERMGIPHYMIDVADPCDDYSVAEYSGAARAVIEDILERGKQPIVCGGSGLYVHSLLYDLDFPGRPEGADLRAQLEREAEEKGAEALFAKLLEADPEAADHVHPNNVKRVIRALERVYCDKESGGLRDFSGTFIAPKVYETRMIRLTADRDKLYERIERRAESFFENGLVREVHDLLNNGTPRDSNAMQGIGYKEVLELIDGKIDEKEALRLVKQNTRRYAKRQETWFKRYTDAEIIIN